VPVHAELVDADRLELERLLSPPNSARSAVIVVMVSAN